MNQHQHQAEILHRLRMSAIETAGCGRRERHGGSSQVADWLDGVGCYPGTVQTMQGGN